MLIEATATRFEQAVQTGRNKPVLVSALDTRGTSVEVILKYSAGNKELGVAGLIAEGLVGLLASDLDLPIPQPYIVRITPEFIASVQISAPPYATLFSNSCPVAFGSSYLKGYSVVSQAWQPSRAMLMQIAEVAAFDAIIQNPDRKPENPNCLQNGKRIAMIDHELAFTHLNLPIFGFQPPWRIDSLGNFLSPKNYLFGTKLKDFSPNFLRFKNAWSRITDERLGDYIRHLPPEWCNSGQLAFAEKVVGYVREARDHLDACLAVVTRAIGG